MYRVFTPTDLESLFNAFALLESGASICLVPPGYETQNSRFAPPEIKIPEASINNRPLFGLYSSGSTGTPKLSWRPWKHLKSEVRLNSGNAGWNWASPFSPHSFAGVQVALQAWATEGQVLSIAPNWAVDSEPLAHFDVHALSCTPTFLDLALQRSASLPRDWMPIQITLGGEPLRAAAGERFRKAFPKTRFTVIYASAEFGVLLKTHRLDGWYERASLDRRFPRWRVEEGELQLWPEGDLSNSCGSCESWQSTGDLVELTGDSIRVLGRADAVANVAGCKVSLAEVSRVAEEVPGVRAASAFAEPNAICGEIVALRFTAEDGVAPHDVRDRLETHLRNTLRKEAWPRRWEAGLLEPGPNAKRSLHPRARLNPAAEIGNNTP